MKKFFLLLMIASTFALRAQEKIYNPDADAAKEIAAAVLQAEQENKHVFVQIGGDWCSWCLRFHQFIGNNAEIKQLIAANYVSVKVNFDPKNESNKELMNTLGNPQRFGFPVFVIIDKNGSRIHTQNSAYLEACNGKGYNTKNVVDFFKQWTPAAVGMN